MICSVIIYQPNLKIIISQSKATKRFLVKLHKVENQLKYFSECFRNAEIVGIFTRRLIVFKVVQQVWSGRPVEVFAPLWESKNDALERKVKLAIRGQNK